MDLKRFLKRCGHQEKGFILMTTYLMVSVLATMSFALFSQEVSQIQSADRNTKRMMAFNMAESGFDKAYYDVKNSAITTFPYTGSYTSMNSGSFRGGYQVTVTDVGNSIRKIEVTGYSPAQTSSTEAVEQRSLIGYMQLPTSTAFDYAAFGSKEITINGNATIDSYNASAGAYSSTSAGSSGTIGTNGTTSGKISLEGNASVKGNAKSGVGSTPATVITTSGNASLTGTKTALTSAKTMTVYTSSITSSGALNLNGNTTTTLAAGTYRYSSLKINGNARLNATGKVTIYVDGEITLNGNGVTTASNNPANMTIYGTTNAKVTLNGNNSYYGAVYAPLAEFEVNGNAKVYGSVIGNDLEINGNAKIHYDTSLGGGGSSSTSLLSWQESGLSNQG